MVKFTCNYCGAEKRGRKARQFCNTTCSNRYHAELKKIDNPEKKITITSSIFPTDKLFLKNNNLSYQLAIHEGTIILRSKQKNKKLLTYNLGFLYIFFIGLIMIFLTPAIFGDSIRLFILFIGIFCTIYGFLNSFFYDVLEQFRDTIESFYK